MMRINFNSPSVRPTACKTAFLTTPTGGEAVPHITLLGAACSVRAPKPFTATYAQRASPNASTLRATKRHFDASASSVPVMSATLPVVPPPAPVNADASIFNLATARTLLSNTEPPPSAEAIIASIAANCRRKTQALVDNVGMEAAVLLFQHTGDVLFPTPNPCAVVIQFMPYNCPKYGSTLLMLMMKLAS